jgi:hypothetical protein
MARLRARREVVAMALNSCTEEKGVRATGPFIECSSRYWISAMAGHKDGLLFQLGTQQA